MASFLWDADRPLERGSLPRLGNMIKDQADDLGAYDYKERL
ncbi:MAG: hypothetical protein ACU84Q_18250 [Gammaproteobacteria bacterium]